MLCFLCTQATHGLQPAPETHKVFKNMLKCRVLQKMQIYYFSLDSHERFLESAMKLFFYWCYHYFAFMFMLIFFLCQSPITLVISSYNFLPPVVEYISSLWAFCCFLKFCLWLAAMEFLHIIITCPAKLDYLIDTKTAASSFCWPWSFSASSGSSTDLKLNPVWENVVGGWVLWGLFGICGCVFLPLSSKWKSTGNAKAGISDLPELWWNIAEIITS